MTAWLQRRRTPPPSDRSQEIGELAAQTSASRSEAERTRALAAKQAARFEHIHAALTHEGAVNTFTKRWAEAFHGGGGTS